MWSVDGQIRGKVKTAFDLMLTASESTVEAITNLRDAHVLAHDGDAGELKGLHLLDEAEHLERAVRQITRAAQSLASKD